MKNWLKKNYPLLLAILFAGLFLWSAFASIEKTEFWYDEAFSGVLVGSPWGIMMAMIEGDLHPPLYYLILKLAAVIFGYSDITLRGLSAISGALLIPLGYLIAKEISGKKFVGLFAAFVISINPFLFQYSQEARMYTLLAVWTLLAVYFFIKAVGEEKEQKQAYYFRWFSLFIGLAFFTHYISLFTIFILMFLALAIFRKRFKIIGNVKKCLFYYLKSFYWLWLSLILWVIFYYHHLKRTIYWVPKVDWKTIPETFYAWLFGTYEKVNGIPKLNEVSLFGGKNVLIAAATILFLASFIRWRKLKGEKREKLFIMVIIWFGTILLVYLMSLGDLLNMYVIRYFLPSSILFLITWAILLSGAKRKMWLGAGIVVYLVLLSYTQSYFPQTNYKELAQYIINNLPRQELIFIDSDQLLITEHYLDPSYRNSIRIHTIDDPTFDFSSWQVITNEQRVIKLEDATSRSLVITSRELNNPAYPKIDQFEQYNIYQKGN